MARDTNILLGEAAWNPRKVAQLDPEQGGQFGYATNPTEWLSAQAYLPRNLIPIVIEAPKFFSRMPNPEKWVTAWRLMFEKHARTIEGLKAGLTVDVVEHQFGGGGEFFQEFADVKRERSTLSIGMVEKYGNVYQSFLERFIIYGMMHPETKTPMVATLEGSAPEDNLADNYGGVVAFIEPDYYAKKCMKCWLSVNVWPQGTGPIEGKMDKTTPASIKELSLDFTSLTFYNEGTHQFGQELLDGINTTWANPHLRESFLNSVSSDVAAVTRGYKESVESVGSATTGLKV